MNKSFKYIPQKDRKKILLICDDIRVHSGVATVAKEIVMETAHHFNWAQIAGAIQHPEAGKRVDLSQDTNKIAGIKDSFVVQYPSNGYGTSQLVRQIIALEKPDAIMLITDPRYFRHIWDMENEIRTKIPITYLNIWDDYPAPAYNKPYYEACDLLMGISKQTVNINKLVLDNVDNSNRLFRYIPHGLNPDVYFPITEDYKRYNEYLQFKVKLLGHVEPKFVAFFNSRNIRRKQIPDMMLAFRCFLDTLPKEEAEKSFLVLHTEISAEQGTDLMRVKEYFFGENYPNNVIFSVQKLSGEQLNYLYNIADVQMLLTSNEGWGLTTTEAILAGTPIISNVTGGMQDQMRFVDENGEWFTPSADIPSNHRGTYKEHGEWAFPVYPTSRSIQGSPPTPYIFDDRCAWEDVVERLKEVYKLGRKKRKELGLKGREWVMSDEAGFTSKHQAYRVMDAFDELFKMWKPRPKFELINANESKAEYLKHKLYY